MNILDLAEKPQGSTHCLVSSHGVVAGGSTRIYVVFFKQAEGEWLRWWTDSDNEYPAWRSVNWAYREGVFESNVLPLLIPLGAKS